LLYRAKLPLVHKSQSIQEVLVQLNKKMNLGEHYICDFSNCNQDLLFDDIRSKQIFFDAVKESGLTIVSEGFYQFSPHGFTCFLLLAESHASLHAWPEYGYCAIDIFTCNLNLNLQPLVDRLKLLLGASNGSVRKLERVAEFEPAMEF
jgi:S-adenosylmethionine decarboxylase